VSRPRYAEDDPRTPAYLFFHVNHGRKRGCLCAQNRARVHCRRRADRLSTGVSQNAERRVVKFGHLTLFHARARAENIACDLVHPGA
jgi:hypothetical protein